MTIFSGSGRQALIQKNAALSFGISIAYLLYSWLLMGFKPEQLGLVFFFLALFNLSVATRNFITGFSIFIIYWIIFDSMKAFPNYRFQPVDIANMYNLEKQHFGISFNGLRLTPNEYWLQNQSVFLDILCGLFYLCWVPVPLLMATYLYFRKRQQFFYFSLTFLTVNLIGFVIYYSHPVAPPWYVQQYGFDLIESTPGNTAGLDRFDHYFGINLFKSIYEKSSNVFAAMPSLHSAYPLIVLYFGLKNKLGLINIAFASIMLGIWFAAVYTSHHYVMDVLTGIACAVTGISIFNMVLKRSKWLPFFILKMTALTSKTA